LTDNESFGRFKQVMNRSADSTSRLKEKSHLNSKADENADSDEFPIDTQYRDN